MAPTTIFVELGAAIVGLAVLARIASRWRFPAIPLYLLAGLAFGRGGLAPLEVSAGFVHVGAEIGVLLLLFMLGLEYTGGELDKSLRGGFTAGVVDFVLNFPPGLVARDSYCNGNRWQRSYLAALLTFHPPVSLPKCLLNSEGWITQKHR